MNLNEIIQANVKIWGNKKYLRWSAPLRLMKRESMIKVVDPQHDWYNMIGFQLGVQVGTTNISVFLPMSSRKGQSGVLDWSQVRRVI